jgi:hypothetical protein
MRSTFVVEEWTHTHAGMWPDLVKTKSFSGLCSLLAVLRRTSNYRTNALYFPKFSSHTSLHGSIGKCCLRRFHLTSLLVHHDRLYKMVKYNFSANSDGIAPIPDLTRICRAFSYWILRTYRQTDRHTWSSIIYVIRIVQTTYKVTVVVHADGVRLYIWTTASNGLIVHPSRRCMRVESHGGMLSTGEPMNSKRSLFQWHFALHKSYMDWPGCEPGPPPWEAVD